MGPPDFLCGVLFLKEPGQHLAQLLRENRLEGWESVFAALEEGQIVGSAPS